MSCRLPVAKKKSVKISRADVYLKPFLVEVTHYAIKDKTNSYYANKLSIFIFRLSPTSPEYLTYFYYKFFFYFVLIAIHDNVAYAQLFFHL